MQIKKALLSAEEKKASAEAASLRDALLECKRLETLAQNALDRLISDLQTAKAVLVEADSRLPELEAEKKAAAASKNFKEAARLAAEAKSLTSSREESQSAVAELEGQENALREDVEEKVAQVEAAEATLRGASRIGGLARCKWLQLAIAEKRDQVDAAAAEENYEEAENLQSEVE